MLPYDSAIYFEPDKPAISVSMLDEFLEQMHQQIEALLEDTLGTGSKKEAKPGEPNYIGILVHAQQIAAMIETLKKINIGEIRLPPPQCGADEFYINDFVWYLPSEQRIAITKHSYIWPAHTKAQKLGKLSELLPVNAAQDERAAQ